MLMNKMARMLFMADKGPCTSTAIYNIPFGAERCQYVLDSCDIESNINFNKLYYCDIDENNIAWIPLGVRN